jgi:cytochrome c biogenesis factor
LTGEDLFLITEQVNQNGTIDFKAIINPLVNLIWAAGLVFLIGSAITLWPDAREERRLAVRYGRLPQQA